MKRKMTDVKRLVLFGFLLFFFAAATGCSMIEMVGMIEENPNVVMEEEATLPRHTIYRPADLDNLTEKLPIVVWGAGGCITYGEVYYEFLSHIADNGYLVIASNGIKEMKPTTPDLLIDAMDWAIDENSDPDSKYYNKLDIEHIAAMGHSCGGLEALHVGAVDSRVTTVVAWDSGIFPKGKLGGATKDDLLGLHGPTMWLNTGPNDIAYPQAEQDYAEVPDYVPSVWANYDLTDLGEGVLGAHLGTFFELEGGVFGETAILWLDFTLKGFEENKTMFVGPECGLCATDERWTVQYKNWD